MCLVYLCGLLYICPRSVTMKRSIWIVLFLVFGVFILPNSFVNTSILQEKYETNECSVNEVRSISYDLKCEDISFHFSEKVNHAPHFSFKINDLARAASHGVKFYRLHFEHKDSNYRGQFCSSNLPISICILLN